MSETTLGRLVALGAPMQKDVLLAPTNLFVPAGPRLGTSGSLGIPPQRPVPKGYKPPGATVVTKNKVKAKPTIVSEEEESVEDSADENEDDEDDDVLSELHDDEEPDHGESSYEKDEMIASSSSEDEAPLIPVPMPSKKKKKKSAQKNPFKAQETETDPADYESRIRRLLGKTNKSEPLPKELIEWSGPCSETELVQHMLTMIRMHTMIRIQNGAAINAKRLLTLHNTQGTGELFADSLKAHCAIRAFGGMDVTEDMLRGCYVPVDGND